MTFGSPVAGCVVCPFKKTHSWNETSAAPGANTPSQSLASPAPSAKAILMVPPRATVGVNTVTDGAGASSSVAITPMPWASPGDAFAGADRFTTNVSDGSIDVSPLIVTPIVRVVANGENVSTP